MVSGVLLLLLISVQCFYSYILAEASTNVSFATVTISLGPSQQLVGLVETTKQTHLYTFYGVPYAAPPIGTKRFMPPEPVSTWSGARDATKKSAICLQVTTEDTTSERSEDCLYLNVFTPDLNGSLPVFVWIHGGGFRTGSAFNDGDGATIAPRGIVTVTINYRLGVFGFLSTEDSIVPGNNGMLDQVMALEWVQKNIKSFGGDPKQVTIGGESAGAMSVSLLIVSPLTQGLFKRAILESGSIFCLGAIQNPSADLKVRNSTFQFGHRAGCNLVTSRFLLICLQKVDANVLLNATQNLIIRPRIETISGFLPADPTLLVKNGLLKAVDTLQGRNSGERGGAVQDPENDGITRQQFIDNIRSQLAQTIMSETLVQEFVQAYIGNETDPIKLRENLVQASSDISFGGTLVEIDSFINNPNASSTKHFLFEFDYRMSGNTSPAWRGVEHAAERRFVFYPDSRFSYSTADDRAVGEAVQTYWANFIKYGDPTPTNNQDSAGLVNWDPFTKTNPNLLKIDAVSKLVPYPRPALFAVYEKALELSKIDSDKTIVG